MIDPNELLDWTSHARDLLEQVENLRLQTQKHPAVSSELESAEMQLETAIDELGKISTESAKRAHSP